MKHFPVLNEEVIRQLNIDPTGIYVDATLGLGGHTREIAKKLTTGKLIVFDQDATALKKAQKDLSEFKNITFIANNFVNLKDELAKLKIEKINGIIYDLGTSYYQLTTPNRGFSYHGDNRLDMRMDQTQSLDAVKVLNTYEVDELTRIFKVYGDEKKAKQLAKKIVSERKIKPIEKTDKFVEIIKSVKGSRRDKHPAKNIFQAVRIEVNDEMNVLKESLNQALDLLNLNGICLVITFHSLEDRIVKELFWNKKEDIIKTQFQNQPRFRTSKSIYPAKKEIAINNPSRSAKLRAIKKVYE